MPGQARINDIGSGHSSWPPTPIQDGASSVFINKRKAAREADPVVSHGSPSPSPVHARAIQGHSTNVTIEGKGSARMGDSINCGGMIITASDNVFVN